LKEGKVVFYSARRFVGGRRKKEDVARKKGDLGKLTLSVQMMEGPIGL